MKPVVYNLPTYTDMQIKHPQWKGSCLLVITHKNKTLSLDDVLETSCADNFVYLFQIFIPILHGLALAVKECSFDSDNFKFPLMVRRGCHTTKVL